MSREHPAAQDHVVCGPDCQCGCEAGRTIPVRSAAKRDPWDGCTCPAEGRHLPSCPADSAATASLADRLRDVDEQNVLVVRRRAADRIEELEAELVEQRSFLLSEVHRAEDERDALRDALRQYANPQHWGISRDDLDHRVVAWIGPGAEKAGLPDAMQVAREALGDA